VFCVTLFDGHWILFPSVGIVFDWLQGCRWFAGGVSILSGCWLGYVRKLVLLLFFGWGYSPIQQEYEDIK